MGGTLNICTLSGTLCGHGKTSRHIIKLQFVLNCKHAFLMILETKRSKCNIYHANLHVSLYKILKKMPIGRSSTQNFLSFSQLTTCNTTTNGGNIQIINEN